LTEQSFGRWKVTDVIGDAVPRKAVVEIRAGDAALTLVQADGSTLGAWPVGRTRFERYGSHNGYLDLAGQSAWITSVDKRPADELAAFLRERWTPLPPAASTAPGENGPTLTRSYLARTPADASRAFTSDADGLLARGYRPASQFWADPDRSTATAIRVGGVLIALASLLFLAAPYVTLLLLALAGALFIIGAASVGEGSLNVTYERAHDAGGQAVPSAGDRADESRDEAVVAARRRLQGLVQLRDDGLISPDEYEAKRSAILAGL
jgi:hypothetical protein